MAENSGIVMASHMVMAKVKADAADSFERLSEIIGDNNYLLKDMGAGKTVIDLVFISSLLVLFKRLDHSPIYKEFLRYTNIVGMVQRFYDRHIRVHQAIHDLSNDVDAARLKFFLGTCTKLGSASVYFCDLQNGNLLMLPPGRYVVKVYNLHTAARAKHLHPSYRAEVDHYKTFRHDNFAEMIAHGDNPDINFIVLKYYEQGPLSTLTNDPSLSWSDTLDILIQVAYIVYTIHFGNGAALTYGDFKPENFLLEVKKIRICDLATITADGNENSTGSPPYVDEHIKTEYAYFRSSDIFKFGRFVIHMVTNQPITLRRDELRDGLPVFDAQMNLDIAVKDRLANGRLKDLIRYTLLQDDCPPQGALDVVKLALECLDPESQNRPSARIVVDRLRSIQMQL